MSQEKFIQMLGDCGVTWKLNIHNGLFLYNRNGDGVYIEEHGNHIAIEKRLEYVFYNAEFYKETRNKITTLLGATYANKLFEYVHSYLIPED